MSASNNVAPTFERESLRTYKLSGPVMRGLTKTVGRASVIGLAASSLPVRPTLASQASLGPSHISGALSPSH